VYENLLRDYDSAETGRNSRQRVLRQYTAADQKVLFTSGGRQNKEIDERIGAENAVLRDLYRPVVTKR